MNYLNKLDRDGKIGFILLHLSGFIFGFGTGQISSVTGSVFSEVAKFYPNELPDDVILAKTLITASAILGAFIYCVPSGFIADRFGRTKALLMASIVGIFGNSLAIAGSAKNSRLMIAGRFFFGLCIGGLSSAGPLYFSELCPAEIRGTLMTTFQIMICFSIAISFVGAFYIESVVTYRVMYGILYVPLFMIVVLYFFAKDTKDQFVNQKNDTDDVEQGTEKFVWRKKKHLLQAGTGLILVFGQQLTGINAIIYYADSLFGSIFGKDELVKKAAASLILMFINMFASLASVFAIKKYGRRTLLLVGIFGMMGSLLVTFVGFLLSGIAKNILALFGIVMFIIFFEFSVGPLFFVIINEIFPKQVRGRVGAVFTGLQWGVNFILTISFSYVFKAIKGYVFLIFSAVAVVCGAMTYFFLPETKDKSFEDIQLEYDKLVGKKK